MIHSIIIPQSFVIAGGEDNIWNLHDTILRFDIKNHIWTEVGHMNKKRQGHAVSVVNSKDVLDYCS